MRQWGLVVAAGLLGWALTGLVLVAAAYGQHMAQPTERGLHARPTPTGGGVGLIGALLILWMIVKWPLPLDVERIAAAVAALAALSWLDDWRPLPPGLRLLGQGLVVGMAVTTLPSSLRLMPMLPLAVERLGIGLGWLWMLNLTNFMDGIDGLAGVEAVTVGGGYTILATMFPPAPGLSVDLSDLALLLMATAAGYLVWNWAPARIFLGDVGSIPLGFLFGLFMLDLGLRGQWAAALILPMYFIVDATITLLARMRRGLKPWHAHREHAYQRAVLAGMRHSAVAVHVAALNVALVALAVVSSVQPWRALAMAAGLTVVLFVWLRTRVASSR